MRTKIEKSRRKIKSYNENRVNMQFIVRPKTTDSKVIDEVIDRNVYEKKKINFFIDEVDTWLDLGSNIGVFTSLVLIKGGKVYSYEPEPENYELLKHNITLFKTLYGNNKVKIYKKGVGLKNGKVKLYLTKNPNNKYRHTIIERKGRKTINISINTLDTILSKHKDVNSIKMDIEGIEIDILERFNGWKKHKIHKLVFEYSFDFDYSISRFVNIIKKLKKYYINVYYPKFDITQKYYKYYPPSRIVHCLGLK